MDGVPFPPFLDFFFCLSSKMSLNRSSTTTLFLSFLIRLKRGSVFRRAKRESDMVAGREERANEEPMRAEDAEIVGVTVRDRGGYL